MNIYNWFSNKRRQRIVIPIQKEISKCQPLCVHIVKKSKIKLNETIIDSLGGFDNIETYRSIPNSKKIRITLVNPNLIDKSSLAHADTQLVMRIGKKIIHIIP